MDIILRDQLRYMKESYEVVGVTSPDNKHFQAIKDREGIRMEAVHMQRGISVWHDLLSLIRLIWMFAKERPLIVHSHTPKAGLLGMMAAWFLRVPIRLHTVAGLPLLAADGRKRQLLNFTEKLTYRLATRVYPNSIGLRSIILEEGFCARPKLHVIGAGSSNGIDLEYFNPFYPKRKEETREAIRQQFKIEEKDTVFLFVGRLAREKGIEELTSAFIRLQSRFSSTRLLLIGPLEKENGPISNESLEQIEKHPSIIHPGRRDDVRPALLAGDIFVFPSYREGFPNALLQAGAMGLPSLASDINGCNEIIKPTYNGLLFPAKNKEALYSVMKYAVENPSEIDTMRDSARGLIKARYSRKALILAWEKEYERLIEQYG